MPQLIIKIQDKIAKPVNDLLVCGNSDYIVKFKFDEEWNSATTKTARFVWGGQYEDVIFTGDTCEIPVISNTDTLSIGVYAGKLRTTTPAIIKCRKSILCDDVMPKKQGHQLVDIDTTRIILSTPNENTPVVQYVWTGTKAEYDAMESHNANTLYLING